MHAAKKHAWGTPFWHIDFTVPPAPLPRAVDFAIIGGGFTGLATAACLRMLAPEKSVAVFEAGRIGEGSSGRTGGLVLAETAAGDLPGLGDVLGGFSAMLSKLGIDCGLTLPGAWEIARKGGEERSPIQWNDSGTLRVLNEVPGGALDPGKLVSGLARSAHALGAAIFESTPVARVLWSEPAQLEIPSGRRIAAGKVLFATNALSLPLSGLTHGTHPKLTLAAATAPLDETQLLAIGLAQRKSFYTVDFPYLWGRLCDDNSIVWGAALVDAEKSNDVEQIDISRPDAARIFSSLEKRIRNLHPALAAAEFTHRWGGPILFRDEWRPIFDFHPESGRKAIVLGAYAGHGVALSSYLGAWAAEALLGRRELPDWGAMRS